MQWLNSIVDELIKRHPEGEILIETGSSPSGTYHLGSLREIVIADAVLLELERRGRQAKHIQFVDDLDALRKIPVNIPQDFEKFLGMPICDAPSPDGKAESYATYFLQDLKDVAKILDLDISYEYAHKKYREGFYVPAIERALERIQAARQALETVSGRKLDEHWSPIQIMDQGRLKNRKFISLNKDSKTIKYLDAYGNEQETSYTDGNVKLDWRLDWPGRWWLLNVACEPSGRDHMTKGGSYDTGVEISKDVYENKPPYPISYDFINMAGDTKKMSASKGTGLDAIEAAQLMPAEVLRYFILRSAPLKRLYFDPVNGVVKLMDEYAALAAKTDRSESEEQLLYISSRNRQERNVSRVPFSLLVASYQAALKDINKTLDNLSRTEYANESKEEAETIKKELSFIDAWLKNQAPEDVKFELSKSLDNSNLSNDQKNFLSTLAEKIESAPEDADGGWFHQTIYDLKDESGLQPKEMFQTLYKVLINKDSGPRAGWFLSILPRDWLVKRLRLEA